MDWIYSSKLPLLADGEWRVEMETRKEAVESRVHILEVELRGSSVR